MAAGGPLMHSRKPAWRDWSMARRRRFSALALAFSLLTAGARAQTFTDISEASGLNAVRAARPDDWWMSGLHFVDLDGDGLLDVFLSSHGSYGALAALGDGNGRFTLVNDGYPESE